MVIIKIQKPDGRDENGKTPAHQHHEKLEGQHDECVDKKHVVPENETHHAVIDEPGIWIENLRDDHHENLAQRDALAEKEIQEHAGKNQPENKFAEIIFPAEAAECFSKIAFVSMIKVAKK